MGTLTWVLAAAEIALLVRLVATWEVVRRPAFSMFLLVSLFSALTYSHDRQRWVMVSTAYSIVIGLVLLESLYWMCQRSHYLQTIAFGITLAMFMIRRAMDEIPEATFGPQVKFQTLVMAYYFIFWAFAVGFVLTNRAVRLQGGRVRPFDWILLGWLGTKAGFRIAGYYIEGGTKNPDWAVWNAAATSLLILCMVVWLFGDRILDYLHHETVADKRRHYRQQDKQKAMLQGYVSH